MSRRTRWAAAGLLVALALGAGLWGALRDRGRWPGATVDPEPRAASAPAAAPAAAEDTRPPPDHRIASGASLALEAAALDPSRPLVLDLAMPDEARGTTGAREVLVTTEDGRSLALSAPVEGPPGSGLRIALDPAWLVPGRYLVNVETEDRSHFQTRRYLLEVR